MLGTCGFSLRSIDAVEDLVVERQLHRLAVGEDALDLLVEVLPLVVAPEVVDHQEAAVEQVAAQGDDLLLREVQAARLDHVDEGIVEQPLVGQPQRDRIGVDLERRELLQPEGEVQVAVGPVGRPSPPPPQPPQP